MKLWIPFVVLEQNVFFYMTSAFHKDFQKVRSDSFWRQVFVTKYLRHVSHCIIFTIWRYASSVKVKRNNRIRRLKSWKWTGSNCIYIVNLYFYVFFKVSSVHDNQWRFDFDLHFLIEFQIKSVNIVALRQSHWKVWFIHAIKIVMKHQTLFCCTANRCNNLLSYLWLFSWILYRKTWECHT